MSKLIPESNYRVGSPFNIEDQTMAVLAEMLDERGYGDIAEIWRSCQFVIGDNLIIRTATFFYTGRLLFYSPDWLILDQCSWIANTGRWSDCLADGIEAQESAEIEIFPPKTVVRVNHQFTVDVCVYGHPLPTESK